MTGSGPYKMSPPMRFLVIEDRQIIRKVLVKMLQAAGHEVAEAAGGEEGIALFSPRSFDAVFTDVNMPGATGWEVAREVKKLEPDCVVVFITGFAHQADPEMMDSCGVDFILQKPFRLEKLMDIVARVAALRKGAPREPQSPEEGCAGI